MRVLAAGVALGLALGALPTAEGRARGRQGTVVDADGKPVEGAIITDQSAMHGGRVSWLGGEPQGFTTDERGHFDLFFHDPGEVICAVKLGVGCSGWLKVPKAGPVVLRLLEGNAIHGMVRAGPAGPGIAGAEVELRVVGDEFFADQGPRTVADEHGRYRFAGIPVGERMQPHVVRSPRIRGWHRKAPGTVVFKKPGEDRPTDLVMTTRTGVWMTWSLVAPDGTTLPAEARVTHYTVTADEARRDDPKEHDPGIDRSVLRKLRSGTFTERTRAATTVPIDPKKPAIKLFCPKGTNQVLVGVGDWGAVTERWTVDGDGEPVAATLTLARRPRIYVQAMAGRKPLRRAKIDVGIAMLFRYSNGFASSGGPDLVTDAEGRVDITDVLPRLEAEMFGQKILIGFGAVLPDPDDEGFGGGGAWDLDPKYAVNLRPADIAKRCGKPDGDGNVLIPVPVTKR